MAVESQRQETSKKKITALFFPNFSVKKNAAETTG
jgi:hypothetical protein